MSILMCEHHTANFYKDHQPFYPCIQIVDRVPIREDDGPKRVLRALPATDVFYNALVLVKGGIPDIGELNNVSNTTLRELSDVNLMSTKAISALRRDLERVGERGFSSYYTFPWTYGKIENFDVVTTYREMTRHSRANNKLNMQRCGMMWPGPITVPTFIPEFLCDQCGLEYFGDSSDLRYIDAMAYLCEWFYINTSLRALAKPDMPCPDMSHYCDLINGIFHMSLELLNDEIDLTKPMMFENGTMVFTGFICFFTMGFINQWSQYCGLGFTSSMSIQLHTAGLTESEINAMWNVPICSLGDDINRFELFGTAGEKRCFWMPPITNTSADYTLQISVVVERRYQNAFIENTDFSNSDDEEFNVDGVLWG